MVASGNINQTTQDVEHHTFRNRNVHPLSSTSLWEELRVNILERLLIYETTGTLLLRHKNLLELLDHVTEQ